MSPRNPLRSPMAYYGGGITGPTVTDFFCGGGGSSEGLAQAGFRVAIACNHDPVSVATHRLNHPDTEHRCVDLHETDHRTLPSTDVLWASPSCVWHARSGGRRQPPAEIERLHGDAGSVDRATAFAVIEAAEVHRYPVVIVENVPEFCAWSLHDWWVEGLHRLGYTMQASVLDAADFGHAQHRRRWFAVFTQPGIHVDLTTTPSAPVYATAILDTDPGKLVTRQLYVSPQIDAIAEPDTPHLVVYRRHARPRRADTHRLAAITAGGNHHGVATIDHTGRAWHRMLSNRECARAQGFGNGYEFIGTRAQVKRQIGNAVPVGIARFLGARVSAALGYTPNQQPAMAS
jgi:DNA (cytosine-5)-methyltransferase 1